MESEYVLVQAKKRQKPSQPFPNESFWKFIAVLTAEINDEKMNQCYETMAYTDAVEEFGKEHPKSLEALASSWEQVAKMNEYTGMLDGIIYTIEELCGEDHPLTKAVRNSRVL